MSSRKKPKTKKSLAESIRDLSIGALAISTAASAMIPTGIAAQFGFPVLEIIAVGSFSAGAIGFMVQAELAIQDGVSAAKETHALKQRRIHGAKPAKRFERSLEKVIELSRSHEGEITRPIKIDPPAGSPVLTNSPNIPQPKILIEDPEADLESLRRRIQKAKLNDERNRDLGNERSSLSL